MQTNDFIQQVQELGYEVAYVDRDNLLQAKSWLPDHGPQSRLELHGLLDGLAYAVKVAEVSLTDSHFAIREARYDPQLTKMYPLLIKFANTPVEERGPVGRMIRVVGDVAYPQPLYLSWQKSHRKLVLAPELPKDKDLVQFMTYDQVNDYLDQANEAETISEEMMQVLEIAVEKAFPEEE